MPLSLLLLFVSLLRIQPNSVYLEVGYLNCHGTSTPAGDMAEVGLNAGTLAACSFMFKKIASDLGQNASDADGIWSSFLEVCDSFFFSESELTSRSTSRLFTHW